MLLAGDVVVVVSEEEGQYTARYSSVGLVRLSRLLLADIHGAIGFGIKFMTGARLYPNLKPAWLTSQLWREVLPEMRQRDGNL